NYSEESVGRLIRDRLAVIAGRDRFGRLKRALRAPIPDVTTFLDDFRDLGPFVPVGHLRYRLLLGRIAEVVRASLPPQAAVLVVSRGDPELVRLAGPKAWHFLRTAEGAYAGHNLADSAEAILRLEELRDRGAEFLLFPATALWWLDHYEEFRRHLESRYH